jgi:hypothetical protein
MFNLTNTAGYGLKLHDKTVNNGVGVFYAKIGRTGNFWQEVNRTSLSG